MKKNFAIMVISTLVFTPILLVSAEETTVAFQNPSAGISLQYPSDWQKRENAMGVGVVIAVLAPRESVEDVFQENVNVIIQDLSASPMTLEDYTKLSENQIKTLLPEGKVFNIEDFTLSGLPAKAMIYSSKQAQLSLKYLGVWAIQNNKAYLVTYTAQQDKFETFLPQAKAIISSIKIN